MDNTNDKHGVLLGLRGRLFLGFGAILFILLAAITIVLFKINSAEAIAHQVIDKQLPAYDTLLDLKSELNQSNSALAFSVLTHDPIYKNIFTNSVSRINALRSTLTAASKNWSNSINTQWIEINDLLTKLQNTQSQIINDPNATSTVASQLQPIVNELMIKLSGSVTDSTTQTGGFIGYFYSEVENGTKEILTGMTSLQYIEYALLLIGALISLFITLYTAKSIFKYINIFRTQSQRIASGDLTQRINVESRDEIGLLGLDLNTMTEGLSTITRQITEACHSMVSMLTQVKNAVDSQSAGASEQASSINQITASLEEIEKSSTQTIEKAKALGEAAERTREKGVLGLDAVEQSVTGMKVVREKVQTIAQTILELSNQTQQVGEITAVVNTLAQQSKMLALNASIEAAKAGEAGKGFAVVATEVKNLAEQSEQSTAQVQKILEDIRRATERAVIAMEEGTKGVDIGTGLVEQTGEIVRSLSEVIHETTIATQQIEAAIRQEGIGIEQITAGMNEINQVTSSSVESVKQTTEAIDNLGNIADSLKKYTELYKV